MSIGVRAGGPAGHLMFPHLPIQWSLKLMFNALRKTFAQINLSDHIAIQISKKNYTKKSV